MTGSEITFDPDEADGEDPDDETTTYGVADDVEIEDAEGHAVDWDDDVADALEDERCEITVVDGVVVRIEILAE